jgi:hypothetical protein
LEGPGTADPYSVIVSALIARLEALEARLDSTGSTSGER